eukprot:g940.t1
MQCVNRHAAPQKQEIRHSNHNYNPLYHPCFGDVVGNFGLAKETDWVTPQKAINSLRKKTVSRKGNLKEESDPKAYYFILMKPLSTSFLIKRFEVGNLMEPPPDYRRRVSFYPILLSNSNFSTMDGLSYMIKLNGIQQANTAKNHKRKVQTDTTPQ